MRNLRRITLTVIASAAVLAGLTACDPDDSLTAPASLTTAPAAPALFAPATTTQAPVKAVRGPEYYMTHSGRWQVPAQIPFGDYQATPTHPLGGYWEQVASIGAEPGDPGFISNDFIDAPDYVHIGPDTKFIQLDDITLTPVG